MAKQGIINSMQGFKHILQEILDGQDILSNVDGLKTVFPREDNKACLNMVIPIEFIKKGKSNIYDHLFATDPSFLSNFMTGNNANGILIVRDELAAYICSSFSDFVNAIPMSSYNKIFCADNICADFTLQKMPEVYKDLTTAQDTGKNIAYHNDFIALDYVRKYILFLYGQKRYPEFFHLLFLFSLLQVSTCTLVNNFPRTQYKELTEYFARTDNQILFNLVKSSSVCIENGFWDLRRKLVKSAKGHLIIAGASLREAFRRGNTNDVSNELIGAIRNHQLTRLSILLTDPFIFEESYECGQPVRDIYETIKSLQENIYREIYEEKERGSNISLHIYFLPLLQIDHAVMTEEFLAFRTNKLWNYKRLYKGNYMLHAADYYYGSKESEYKAHREYLHMIMNNSTIIYPDVNFDDSSPAERFSIHSHYMEWREFLLNSDCDNICLHKVYEKQIFSYVCSTWSSGNGRLGEFTPSSHIREYLDLYNPENLLNDRTQQLLLPYIHETEHLFTEAIKKHDQGKNSFCHIIPSLDLCFPNNVQRLAGGFATGMLVTWNCGIDIIPVDATVNICTSSVYKLDRINRQWITNPRIFYNMVKEYSIKSEEKGYSFSFLTGNHFLLLAKDSSLDEYYIVMHSSANELKNSYMGLYPVEGNWYSDKVKHIEGKEGRYLNYLKDEDARYFVRMVKNLQKYNEQIHLWLAKEINGGEFSNNDNWMRHHYYMPTSQSIAIGTFAEPIGTQVPIFSAYKKPVYIFEIGPDNFQINLGEKKGKVCLVPHGWGQEIEHVTNIRVDKENRKLIISTDEGAFSAKIKSKEHIECHGKKIRQFKDGKEFLQMGHNYIQGRIVKTLLPVCEYSKNSIKAIEKEETK